MTAAPQGEGGPIQPPQAMRLRARRPAVTRLSRKVLLGLGTGAAVSIGGALLLALQPAQRDAGSELYTTDHRGTPDGLAALPQDYTGLPRNTPRLGPPLPGDLGRPILQAGAPAPPMVIQTGPSDPEAQRIAQEQEAARTSKLFATTTLRPERAAVPSSATQPAPTVSATPDTGIEDHKLAFLNGAVDRRTTSPDRIQAPASRSIVQAGAVILAALVTGLRSDLPGQVVAQVTEDVYDSPTGRIRLIPQGSKLIGQYDAQIAFGQSRALLVWNRLILPNGHSIVLERQPGTDSEGYAGLADQVDNHWGMLFKAAVLTTLLSVGSEAGTSGTENDLIQAIRRGGAQSFDRIGTQIIGRSLSGQPTITIRPGVPVRVLVTHDLVLEPYAD